ncbi:MAG: 30S ribosomal protein S9 [Chlamydiae bacterium]|nr:30S ribosomal protein S9 [Chlamydiota bacterium]
MKEVIGVGRRKQAVAAVRLRKGKGKIDINGRKLEEYFLTTFQREIVLSPLQKIESVGKYDLIIRLKGGGIEAQAVATRLGLSRALVAENEELRSQFKELGYLTRDPRKKERKKYGLRKARKRGQHSKR